MSIRKGNVIIAGNVDAVYDTDDVTTTINAQEKITAIGTLNKNNNLPKYDWIGTREQYNALEEYNNDWLYFITDDTTETITLVNCVGQIIQAMCTENYIPNGCIPCDGTEYAAERFINFWTNYLTSQPSKVLTCTYNEYNTSILTYGQCAKFAVDISAQTFKAPTIKDGSFIQQALSNSELGKSYNAGLPNITGQINTASSNNIVEVASGAFGGIDKANRSVPNNSSSSYNLYKSFDIDASRSSSIYGNSDTVQPNAVALKFFVVVVDTYLNQSQLDWTTYTQSLNKKADSNLINTGMITNCITEIPQNLKIETSGYFAIIKAGSKIYIPNGSNTFNEVTLQSNIESGYEASANRLVFISNEGVAYSTNIENCYSGNVAPEGTSTSVRFWYDTVNNIVKRSLANTSTFEGQWSLPICIFHCVDSTTLIIDQIFNGFGYIGNTIFSLPGIKGLAPNGRNSDGTLNSLQIITSDVYTMTFDGENTASLNVFLTQTGLANWWDQDSYVSNILPNADYTHVYMPAKNEYWFRNTGDYLKAYDCLCARARIENSRITLLEPKNTLQLQDYSEADCVIAYKRPTDSDKTWYRLYKSGWVEQGGQTTVSVNSQVITFIIPFADTNYSVIVGNMNTTANTSGVNVTSLACNLTTTTFQVSQTNSSTRYTTWEAKGFAAGY